MHRPPAQSLVSALALSAASLVAIDGAALAKDTAAVTKAPTPQHRIPVDRVQAPAKRFNFNQIVYVYSGKLFVCDPNGDNARQLATGLPDGVNAWSPAFSPDGKRIAFVAQWWDQENLSHRFDLYTVGSNGKNLRKQAAVDPDAQRCKVTAPDWLDNNTLVYGYSEKPGFGQPATSGLYTLRLHTHNPQPLEGTAPGGVSTPVVSPDGKSIAYSHTAQSGHPPKVRILNLETGEDRPLTTSGYGEQRHPRWSPDGAKLTFHKEWGSDTQVYLINADGTGLQQLTFRDPDDNPMTHFESSYQASWRADGLTLLMTRRAGGYAGLIEYEIAGGAVTVFEEQDALITSPAYNPRYNGPLVQKEGRPERVEKNQPSRPVQVTARDQIEVPAEPELRRRRP
ncbi:MAG: hypothetical protein AAF612_10870 [Planctomycetota bacterium]